MKTVMIANIFIKCVGFICATFAACYFRMWQLLWFLLIPMFCGFDYKTEKTSDKTTEKADN